VEQHVRQTWEEREQPILEAIYDAEESGHQSDLAEIAAATSLDPAIVQRSARDLLDANFINGAHLMMGGGVFEMSNIRLLERGRRAIGQWPSQDPFDNLMHLLEAKIATEKDPEKRSKLERFAGQVGEVGKDIVTGVLTALVRQTAGL
jgi:DNA-binding MarR family transcriptional regulator